MVENNIPNLSSLKLIEYQALVNKAQKNAIATVKLTDKDIIEIIAKFFNVSINNVYLSTFPKVDRDGETLHTPYSEVKVKMDFG